MLHGEKQHCIKTKLLGICFWRKRQPVYRDKRVREKYLPELIEKIEEIYRNKSEDGDLNDAQF